MAGRHSTRTLKRGSGRRWSTPSSRARAGSRSVPARARRSQSRSSPTRGGGGARRSGRGHRNHLRAVRSPQSVSPRRLVALLVALAVMFGLMGARLFVLQVIESGEFQEIAAQQRLKVVELPARRGTVLDRDGDTLAVSVGTQMVTADPTLIDDFQATAEKLAPLVRLPVEKVEASLRGGDVSPRFSYVARHVRPKVAQRVDELGLAGIDTRLDPTRVYPNGRLASHLLGFVNVDGSVKEGIEAQYNDVLEGTPGRIVMESDPSGHPLPQADYSYVGPQAGSSLLMTLDKDIQYFAERMLRDAVKQFKAIAGTAIVMRPDTGEVLALANAPDFDPNSYESSDADSRRNRALTDVYEPGSVFKLVTASAALAERVVTPSTTFMVPDALQVSSTTINDSHAHETERMSVRRIIQESSNVGTVLMGQELGKRKLDQWVRNFGFGTPTGLDFPGETSGLVIDLEDWSGPTIGNIPIGQGVAVTPIQMLSAFATIANGGVWVEPKLLYGTANPDGTSERASAAETKRIVPRRVARQMTSILGGVVNKGTGIEAQIPGYQVAGKTGTAQKVENGAYGAGRVASFAGFAPAHDPQVAAIVVLDEPTPIWGGSTSAPTFKTIMQRALRELGVPPDHNAERAAFEIQQDATSDLSSTD
jgi:cell division protein FtsI/penicillin-binding protein 2